MPGLLAIAPPGLVHAASDRSRHGFGGSRSRTSIG
jgi:hypothetical protein